MVGISPKTERTSESDAWFTGAGQAPDASASSGYQADLARPPRTRRSGSRRALRHLGGLIETERAAAHQAWLAAVKVTVLLAPAPRARGDSGDRARRLGFSLRRRPPLRGDAGQLDPRGDGELAEDLAQVE